MNSIYVEINYYEKFVEAEFFDCNCKIVVLIN